MKTIQLSFVAAILCTSSLFAQEETITLDQITVTAKTQKSIDGVAATVEVITREEIERIEVVKGPMSSLYGADKVTLYGGINNITDESVDKMIGSNMGRYYFVGARVRF